MSTLSKKIKDLTPEDIQELEKPLGTSSRAFPMWGTVAVDVDGKQMLVQRLTVIADDDASMTVFSERPYSEVMGMAFRDMPVPSMLPVFFDGLEKRRLFDEKGKPRKNKVQFVKGDPGAGKSFMGALQSRMRSSEPAEVLDCGGKNMRELLFETVLDFGAGDALPDAIDRRISDGTLKPLSVGLLIDLPGGFVDQNDDGSIQSIDWEGLKESGSENVQAAYDILTKVSKIEGLDGAGGNALGMNTQYGPLITSFINGTELTLDEYNKSKEGTDDNLQTFWQFATGEIDECNVENPLKDKNAKGAQSFTFRRENQKAGWFITMTGNKTEDGITTRRLNKSVNSRLDPQILPDPTVMDWQHRICQIMTGLPISTLYNVYKEHADKDPVMFGKKLMEWRTLGLTEDEIKNIPEIQVTLIQNWQATYDATKKLAEFYSGWAELVDPEKGPAKHHELYEEIDEEFSEEVSIDFRKIIKHIEEALPIKPRMQSLDAKLVFDTGSWGEAPKVEKKAQEDVALHFGTRLTDLLIRKAYETSGAVGKVQLYEQLKMLMENTGLKELHLQEASRSRQKSIEELLNISAFDDQDPSKQAELAQKLFCDYLREVDAQIQVEDDEQIITVTQLRQVVDRLNDAQNADEGGLLLPNMDYDTLSTQPFVGAAVETPLPPASDTDVSIEAPAIESLASHDEVMATLAIPAVGRKNINAFWDTFVSDHKDRFGVGTGEEFEDVPADKSLNMAENRHHTGLAVSTVIVKQVNNGQATEVPIHVVRNSDRDKTIVVSDAISPRLEGIFKEAGITHIDRKAPNAQAKVETALAELVRGTPEGSVDVLANAFGLWNDTYEHENESLSSLMVNDNVERLVHKYVVKGPKAA